MRLKCLVRCFILFCVSAIESESVKENREIILTDHVDDEHIFHNEVQVVDNVNTIENGSTVQDTNNNYGEGNNDDNIAVIEASFYKNVKKYVCIGNQYNDVDDHVTLTYGTKAWVFPKQDVNLTLSYPSLTEADDFVDYNYTITGIKVILSLDGGVSHGYVTEGGIMQKSLKLSFLCSNVTVLSYNFWLYGLPDAMMPHTEANNKYIPLC